MFYITISNGLLLDDHHERMGNAVWLFMWLIDKVTKIDDKGWGWVLGGKPINLDDIQHIPRRTAQRYLATLRDEGYIDVTRTMYGFIVKVAKAKKPFRKPTSDAPKVAHQDRTKVAHPRDKSGASLTKSGASNKTIQLDKTTDITVRGKTPSDEATEFFKQGEVYHELRSLLIEHISPKAVDRELSKFGSYWTEPNKLGTRQRWQLEPTFDVKRRLRTWLERASGDYQKTKKGKGLIL